MEMNLRTTWRAVCQWGLLSLLLTSCGIVQPFDHQKNRSGGRQFDTMNPEFSAYIDAFEKRAQKILSEEEYRIGDIPINFGDTEKEGRVGVCFEYQNGEKEVIIEKSWWNRQGEDSKESLIFHELGHCALGRGHNNETASINGQTYKLSMMNQNLVQGDPYKDFKNDYHQELFTQDEVQLVESLSSESDDSQKEDSVRGLVSR